MEDPLIWEELPPGYTAEEFPGLTVDVFATKASVRNGSTRARPTGRHPKETFREEDLAPNGFEKR